MKKRVINYSVNTKYCVYVKSTLTKMINFKFVYIIFITKKKRKEEIFVSISHSSQPDDSFFCFCCTISRRLFSLSFKLFCR